MGSRSISGLVHGIEMVTAVVHPLVELGFTQRGEHGAFGHAGFMSRQRQCDAELAPMCLALSKLEER